MNLWRSLAEVPGRPPHPVVTIGNFDGVHLGHVQILRLVKSRAENAGGTPVVITFDPHPTHIVAPERAPRQLTPMPFKLELFERAGMKAVLVVPFTIELSRLTPEQFARQVLADRLGAKEVIVGHNFHFGHDQAGDLATLQKLGRQLGFRAEGIAPVAVRRRMVSSSRIRDLIAAGNVTVANRMLGRCFSVRGRIVSGMHIGRSRTVPTLNLEPYQDMLPGNGIYITETACDYGPPAISVTNVGESPTFHINQLRVESFLLDTVPPPDAQRMEVIFWRRLRDEVEFPSAETLKAQILRDADRGRAFFRRLGHNALKQTQA